MTATCAFALGGCQFSFLEDAPKPVDAIQVAGGGEACLEAALPVIENYFSGSARAEEVGQAWDCASTALDTFMAYTRGRDASSYSALELRSFLESYFLGDVRVSDPLLIEIMRLKQHLLGGELGRVSRDELTRAHAVLSVLKKESLLLLPYVRLITMEEPVDLALRRPDRVESAIREVSQATRALGDLFGHSNEPYEIKHLETLLREIQVLYQGRSAWSGPGWLLDHISTFTIAKTFLLKPDGATIAPDEWQTLFARGGDLFGLYLRVHYLLGDRDLLSGDGLDQLHATLNPLFDLLNEITKSKPDQLIPYGEMDPMVDEILRLKLIDWKVRDTTLKSVVRSVLEKVVNPPVGGESVTQGDLDASARPPAPGLRRSMGGLRPENLARFREGLMGWLSMQDLWRDLIREAESRDPSLRGKPIPLSVVRKIWPTLQTKYKDQAEDLNRLFNRTLPISISVDGTVVFERDPKKIAFSQDGFNSLNWKQSFIRAVVMGYAADPLASRYTGLTKDEFKDFFDDVRALGVDLNFLDPGDEGIWSSTFAEANMFMLASDANEPDGASRLSFFEGVDLISYALSGSQMSRGVYRDLGANCRGYAPDVFGIPKVEPDCYRRWFQEHFLQNYRFLPQWARLVKGLSGREKRAFQKELELAARKKGYSDDLIESTDIDRGTMIFQYIEAIFTRFDANKSGALELSEAERAFPMLKDVLAEASGISDSNTLYALFTYLLKFGEPPESLKDKLWFQFIWKADRRMWTISADRRQVLRIIAKLNSKPAAK